MTKTKAPATSRNMGLISKKRKRFGKMKRLLILPLRFEDEPRQACIGKLHGKHWTAVITCHEGVVRLISVRRSHKNEVAAYESD